MAGLGHLVKGIGDLDEIASMNDYILLLSNDFEGSEDLNELTPNTLVVDEAHMYSRALQEHPAHYEAFTYLQRWSMEWTHQGEVERCSAVVRDTSTGRQGRLFYDAALAVPKQISIHPKVVPCSIPV